MKKIFSAALALLLVLCCFGGITAGAANAGKGILVVDDAGVLTQEEWQTLSDYAESIAASYPYEIVLYYADDLYDRSAQALADDFFDYYDYGYGSGRDGLVLMVCPSARRYAFSGHGAAIELFDSDRLDELEDSVTVNLSADDWYNAGVSYLTLSVEYLQAGMPDHGMGIPLAVGVSLLIGFVLAFVWVSILRGQLHSVAQGSEAWDYVVPNGIRVTNSHDHFVHTFTRRRQIERSSSGSGTHTSSSGETHSGRSGSF